MHVCVSKFECVFVHAAEAVRVHGGISTQNPVRGVTSRGEIGLVSPVIKWRGQKGRREENWKKGNGYFPTSSPPPPHSHSLLPLPHCTPTIISFQTPAAECIKRSAATAIMEPAGVNGIFICRLKTEKKPECASPYHLHPYCISHSQDCLC